MSVNRRIRLNLRNFGNLPAIMLSQYDEGYNLVFEIFDGASAAGDLSGYTATLKGVRSDTLSYSFTGTISNNVLTFEIDTTMTGVAGKGTAEIVLTASGVVFATFNMPVFVEKAAVPDGSVDADVTRAEEVAEQIQEIVDNAATVNASLGTLSNLTTTDKSSVVAAINEVDADVSQIKEDFNDLINSVYVTDSVSGSVAHFVDGADNVPMKSVKVNIEPVQSGSGDPSPDNVRPISGWTGLNVMRAGKNLADGSYPAVYNANHCNLFLGYLKAGTYVLSTNRKSGFAIYIRKTATPIYSGEYITLSVGGNDCKFTITEDGWYFSHGYRATNAPTWEELPITEVQLELGSTATPYEPYNGTTYDISLSSAGTVYGGTLDVTSGELKVTHGYIASYSGQTLPSAWISDRNVYAEGTIPTTGAQVVYQLATPITYNLTPTEIKSLLGINNVWSDAGDMDVEYRADTKLYIDKRLGV